MKEPGLNITLVTEGTIRLNTALQPAKYLTPEQVETARQLLKYRIRILESFAFGADGDTGYTQSNSSWTLDDMLTAVNELRERIGVTAVCIWFIDCPYLYYSFLNEVSEHVSQPGERPNPLNLTVMGIPIVQWYSHFMGPDDQIAEDHQPLTWDQLQAARAQGGHIWPWICRHPGVWSEMNDGTFRKLLVGEPR